MNAMARMIVVVLLAFACWALAGATASAHTALLNSDPADAATVGSVPTVVTLTFSEDINPAFANVVVNGSDGRNWGTEPPRVAGPELRVSVSPDTPAGAQYTVGYRVVSQDGHPVAGSITFSVAGVAGASATPTPADAAPTTTAAPSSAGPVGSDSRNSIITAAVAGLVLGGAIAFWQSRRRRRTGPPRDDT